MYLFHSFYTFLWIMLAFKESYIKILFSPMETFFILPVGVGFGVLLSLHLFFLTVVLSIVYFLYFIHFFPLIFQLFILFLFFFFFFKFFSWGWLPSISWQLFDLFIMVASLAVLEDHPCGLEDRPCGAWRGAQFGVILKASNLGSHKCPWEWASTDISWETPGQHFVVALTKDLKNVISLLLY